MKSIRRLLPIPSSGVFARSAVTTTMTSSTCRMCEKGLFNQSASAQPSLQSGNGFDSAKGYNNEGEADEPGASVGNGVEK